MWRLNHTTYWCYLVIFAVVSGVAKALTDATLQKTEDAFSLTAVAGDVFILGCAGFGATVGFCVGRRAYLWSVGKTRNQVERDINAN